jgi:uncharacterized protein (TIGR02246 family)
VKQIPILASLLAVLLPSTAFAQRGALSRNDLAIIRGLDDAYVDAWKSNDPTAVLSLFAPDSVIVPQNHAAIAGLRDIAAFWWPKGGKTTITSFDHTIVEAGGAGDFAFTRGTYQFTFDYESNGRMEKLANRGNYLMLMRRVDGVWRITHRMWADLPRK